MAGSKGSSSAQKGSTTQEQSIYSLPSRVDISSINQIYDDLQSVVPGCQAFSCNAASVERITTPGVQLLLVAAQQLKNNNGTFSVIEPSEAFVRMVSDLGFSSQLNEWTCIHG